MDKMPKNGGLIQEGIAFVVSAVLVVLAIAGMIGLMYHALAPRGLIAPWISTLWVKHPVVACVLSIALVTGILAVRSRALGFKGGKGNNELPLYFFVALGLVFTSRLMLTGTP